MNIGEMDAAEARRTSCGSISERLRWRSTRHARRDAYERDALWEAGYRVSVASKKVAEALAEGGLK